MPVIQPPRDCEFEMPFSNRLNNRTPLSRLGLWACVVTVSTGVVAFDGVQRSGQSSAAKKSGTPKRTYPTAIAATPEERESEAIDFAQSYHPELAKLVVNLKRAAPEEYKNAIRDLFFSAHRINRMQRDSERHDLELRVWKAESRARLYAARMAGTSDLEARRAAETKLRSTLKQLTAARLAKLKMEQQRLTKRLESLNATIGDIESNPTAAAEREFNRLQRSLSPKSKNTPRKKPSKNAVKTVSTNSDPSSD